MRRGRTNLAGTQRCSTCIRELPWSQTELAVPDDRTQRAASRRLSYRIPILCSDTATAARRHVKPYKICSLLGGSMHLFQGNLANPTAQTGPGTSGMKEDGCVEETTSNSARPANASHVGPLLHTIHTMGGALPCHQANKQAFGISRLAAAHQASCRCPSIIFYPSFPFFFVHSPSISISWLFW